ncbi:MAG: sulfatase-like hydrolase/transferase [Candidatus Aminicenantes bacterium]|nr:sulfatase-like hydrolase/transferase [Candidatus Aminicenantes bacterium]
MNKRIFFTINGFKRSRPPGPRLKSVLKSGLTIALSLVLCLVLPLCKQEKKNRTGPAREIKKRADYNVLLITIDTLRQDRLSLYSKEHVKTPHIDRLAKKSFVFNRAFAHNPVTLPSHVNILTGTTPLYHGISDNTGFRLEEKFLTLAEYLKEKGYDTGAFVGAFPLDSRFGLNQGFDVYDDNYGTHSSLELFFVERTAAKVIAPAREWISRRQGKWFSWVHLFDPHQPYLPPAPFDKIYADDPYSGEAAYVDQELGKLFAFLEKEKLLDNTVLIITADHGEALGEKGEKTHSYFAYNNTILVPLIVYIPGAGKGSIETNAAHADIFPTVCDILGFPVPGHMQGESLLPIIRGRERQNRAIYFESMTPYLNRGWAPLRGFVRDHTKFIDLPIKEVYDLEKDIHENKNLVGTSNLGKLKQDLEQLKNKLTGKERTSRAEKIDPEVQKRLQSLGYLSSRSVTQKSEFTRADDLKTLLPLQNKMLEAQGKYHLGEIDEAIAELKEVTVESPHFIRVYNRLANMYKETGRVDRGIAILRRGLEANPGNLNILSKMGIFLVEANRAREAVEILKECVAKDKFDPETFNFLGVAYYKTGKFDLALRSYTGALEIDNNYAAVYNNIGSLYLSAFIKNKDRPSYNIAMENFDKAIAIDPRLHSAYNGRGAANLFGNRVEQAVADWKKAIEIKPDFIDPYFSIGITCLKTGDKAAALKNFLLLKERHYSKLPPRDRQRLERLIKEAGY